VGPYIDEVSELNAAQLITLTGRLFQIWIKHMNQVSEPVNAWCVLDNDLGRTLSFLLAYHYCVLIDEHASFEETRRQHPDSR
jgi:hypothetical protein